MGLLVYHEGYPTEQIPTGFISVAISDGLWLISTNLTGLHRREEERVMLPEASCWNMMFKKIFDLHTEPW